MISTDTAAIRPYDSAGGGPQNAQAAKDTRATASTAGTKYPDTVSAMRWIGARLLCASATNATIWASIVPAPTLSARITNEPVPFTVPPISRSPGCLATGMDSPVTIDSSTALLPSSTVPSTGTPAPGRTRRRSPGCTSASRISSSSPLSLRRRAVFGARFSKARIAPPVRSRARSSRTCPSKTRTMITDAASKYTGTVLSMPWNPAGNRSGAKMATRL